MIYINKDFCKGCVLCVKFCPKNVLKMSDEINKKGYYLVKIENSSNCVVCGMCELICPDQAIAVRK